MKRSSIRARLADNHLDRAAWEDRFHLLLTRSGGTCEGRTPACLAPAGQITGFLAREQVSVQHRRAQGMGGTSLAETHSLANHLLLCGTGTTGCHGWVEVTERALAEQRGLWIRHDTRDGVPVPPEAYPLVLWSGRRVLLHPTAPIYVDHPDPWGTGPLTPVEEPS